MNAYAREWRFRNRARVARIAKKKNLKKLYGVTLEWFDEQKARQNNLCAICKQPERRGWRGGPRDLAVDHNHTTGQVRELLCARCNVAIGSLEESILILESAIAYLRKWNA